MQNNASFLSMLEQRCVITRLMDEMREALREFREDPHAYVAGALRRDIGGSDARHFCGWASRSVFHSMQLPFYQ